MHLKNGARPLNWRRDGDSNPRYGANRIHAFQACSFNHSDTSPNRTTLILSQTHLYFIAHKKTFLLYNIYNMPREFTETVIQLNNISKRYGFGDSEYYALKNFDLTVKRGEFIMIMGPSGCGKTTLLNIIGLLDKPTSGEYILADKSVARISNRKKAHFRARQIGFIFQGFNLIPNIPVIENVSLPLIYSGFNKTRRLKMADNILDHFHLQSREYYMPYQLSGGQQQRVAIARSLVASPSIILADEPTGNLDSRSSQIVMEELRNIHSLGNTIIMVTHNPNLTVYATRVINMLDGEIDTDIRTGYNGLVSVRINRKPKENNIPEIQPTEVKPENPKDQKITISETEPEEMSTVTQDETKEEGNTSINQDESATSIPVVREIKAPGHSLRETKISIKETSSQETETKEESKTTKSKAKKTKKTRKKKGDK